jgi:hypothetical protein
VRAAFLAVFGSSAAQALAPVASNKAVGAASAVRREMSRLRFVMSVLLPLANAEPRRLRSTSKIGLAGSCD